LLRHDKPTSFVGAMRIELIAPDYQRMCIAWSNNSSF
jgi:hypothetical protein